MSIENIKAVWDHSRQPGTKRLVMIALADMANADGYCWPSIPLIARMCKCTNRYIMKIIPELEASGELYVDHRPGRTRGNIYMLTLNVSVDSFAKRLIHYLDYGPTEALGIALTHLGKGEHESQIVNNSSPLPQKLKVNNSREKVNPSSPDPIEPIRTNTDPSFSDQGVDRARSTPSPAPAEPPKRELLVPNDGYDLKPRNGASPSPNSGGPLPHMERTVSVKPKRGRSNADRLSPHVKGAKFTEADLVEPGTGANAVAVFYEFYSIYKYRLSAPVEDRLVKRDLNLAQWRSAVEAWQDADHRPTYIKGILDWYNDPSKIASSNKPARKEQSSNGNQPTAPAPAEPSPYAKLKAGR